MNTHTSWVWVGSTALTMAVMPPRSTPCCPPEMGPGDAIEKVVRAASTAFDLNAELAPWLAVSDEAIQGLWKIA